jgi:hypothetical protein
MGTIGGGGVGAMVGTVEVLSLILRVICNLSENNFQLIGFT